MQFESRQSRLLHWMRYSRNVSTETKEIERQTCPLLWCRRVCFDDQELFDHVRHCPYLTNGEYWCAVCSKTESLYCKPYETATSDQLPQADIIYQCLMERAKELFHRMGIGYVSVLPRRSISLSAENHSYSRLD